MCCVKALGIESALTMHFVFSVDGVVCGSLLSGSLRLQGRQRVHFRGPNSGLISTAGLLF